MQLNTDLLPLPELAELLDIDKEGYELVRLFVHLRREHGLKLETLDDAPAYTPKDAHAALMAHHEECEVELEDFDLSDYIPDHIPTKKERIAEALARGLITEDGVDELAKPQMASFKNMDTKTARLKALDDLNLMPVERIESQVFYDPTAAESTVELWVIFNTGREEELANREKPARAKRSGSQHSSKHAPRETRLPKQPTREEIYARTYANRLGLVTGSQAAERYGKCGDSTERGAFIERLKRYGLVSAHHLKRIKLYEPKKIAAICTTHGPEIIHEDPEWAKAAGITWQPQSVKVEAQLITTKNLYTLRAFLNGKMLNGKSITDEQLPDIEAELNTYYALRPQAPGPPKQYRNIDLKRSWDQFKADM